MNEIVAVIDIGSTAIRLMVIEVSKKGEYKRLDRSSNPTTLGRDVFLNRYISVDSMKQVINTLRLFCEQLQAWKIAPEHVNAVGTSAVREAVNRDIFIDRIRTATNIEVHVLDGVEENHLTYIAVMHAIRNLRRTLSKSNSIIMEVGGGTTEIMILKKGRMSEALNLKLGTLRLEQEFQRSSESNYEGFLIQAILPRLLILQERIRLKEIHNFIMVGGDARLAARIIGMPEDDHYSQIQADQFMNWIDSISRLDNEEIVTQLGLSYTEVEGLFPALIIFKIFLDATSAKRIIVPDVTLRDGLLLRTVTELSTTFDEDFTKQILASAWSLGSRYSKDEEYTTLVVRCALQIYDSIAQARTLGSHERIYLEVAAILHRIGLYISQSGYHRHGQYIVSNSEIFGLTDGEIQIVANVVRYHRRNRPFDTHPQFAALRTNQRLVVIKLSAIIRLAVMVIDNLHQVPEIQVQDNDFFVRSEALRQGKSRSSSFFEEVFGYRVIFQKNR